MILIANILQALATLMEWFSGLLTLYQYVLLANVIISWVHADPYNPIVRFVYRITDPLLNRIRRHMPDTGMIDLSPMVAFALIFIIKKVVLQTAIEYLMTYGMALKLRG